MFETFELQYLNKLVEGEVGNFASPQAFHAVKVERLGGDQVKPSTQVSGKFPMPIFALVGNFTIEPCQLSDGAPPVTRPFDFSAECLVEFSELFQGLFQELRMLYLLTCVEREKSVFHTEVHAYALTCSSNGFGCEIVSNDIKPIHANAVAKDLDIADVARPIAVMVIQDVSANKYELLFAYVPFFEGQTDRLFREFVARLELRRAVAPFAFELWQPTESAEKTLVGGIQANNHSIKGVARNPSPVLLGAVQQLRQVRLQAIPSGILTIDAVIAFLQLQEVVMHIAKVIEHIAQTLVLRMFAYLVFVRSQGLSRITSLTPYQGGLGTDTPCDALGSVPNAM